MKKKKASDDDIALRFFPGLIGGGKGYNPLEASREEQEERAAIIDTKYGADFDIRKLMSEAEDPLTGTLRDLKIDDRDLPTAKNYYDYVFNLAGPDRNPPWARQMWASLKFFGEICPKCSNKKWRHVENVPKDYNTKDMLEHLVLLEHGICPKCKRTKRQLVRKERIFNYQEAVLVWGQRSGKSTTVAGMSDYHLHRFLKFPRFHTLTKKMSAATPLTFTFVSLTYGKAVSVLWEPFLGMVEGSKWFDQYFELMDFYGNKYGKELYVVKKEFMKFHHKKLHLAPSHPNKSILRGDTRFGAAIDELGLFPLPTGNDEEDEQSERANADEAHKSLTNSLLTVQTAAGKFLQQGYHHVPSGYMFGVSSPMSERDKVMRLLKESQGEEGKKYIFGSQLATWDVNPDIERTTPMIAVAFERNPEKAMRDFGAVPPRVSNVFIHVNTVKEGIFVGPRNSHLMDYDFTDGEICGFVRRVANVNSPSLLSIDAGEVNNSFTCTVFNFDFKTGKTNLTTVIEIMPQKGRRINHNKTYHQILLPLVDECNVHVALADRWNSLDLLQRLATERGIKVQQISPRRRDFDAALSMLENRTVVCPKPEMPMDEFIEESPENYRTFFVNKPVAHLAHQITTVQDVPGKTPVKGPGYTDDIFRAFVLGASKIHHPKIQEVLQKAAEKVNRAQSPKPFAMGRSGMIFGRR